LESEHEIIELNIKDYVSPECSCRIEDIVSRIPHVLESAFDPVNNILKVKVHRGMASDMDIIEELKQCKVRCEQRMPSHEMAQMEHETMKAKKPAAHDHSACALIVNVNPPQFPSLATVNACFLEQLQKNTHLQPRITYQTVQFAFQGQEKRFILSRKPRALLPP